MLLLPSSPSISTFISTHPPLTTLETKCTSMKTLHQLHSQLIKSGLAHHPIAASRLLNFCASSPSGDLNYAILLFSHTPNPTAFMYNTLIRVLSKSSNPQSAIALFVQMLHSPTHPQNLTFPSVFTAYAHLNSAHEGAQLHGFVLKRGLDLDLYIHNSMISMYANCGCLVEAWRLFDECEVFDLVPFNSMIMGLAKKGLVDYAKYMFDEMPVRNVVTWSAMISGYVRNGKNREALDLFGEMQAENIEPNRQIMVSLLGACASIGALEQGEWIHAYIEKNKLESNLMVTTSIIDMYCKCGSLEKAIQVFENAPVKGLSMWNTMISGLSMHGHGREAIQMFSRLESSSGLAPDGVSFVSVLTACNHCGLVKEVEYYFKMMTEVYGIEPRIEHYGCFVDVLSRAGLVREAEDLIGRMHIEPDGMIWGSLLSGCRNCGEMEIGRRAWARIVEIDPRDSGGYVMLSNGCAEGGDFGGAMRARLGMKEKGVRKEPGCSMIEVGGGAHEFVAGGMQHPQAREICGLLDGLVLNMRSFGCFGCFGLGVMECVAY